MDRFISNEGTVRDTATGLMWQQTLSRIPLTWKEAVKYCAESTLAGFTDWRLPTIHELFSIVDFTSENVNFIDQNYFDVPEIDRIGHHWSSTVYYIAYGGKTDSAWYVSFFSGGVFYRDKTNVCYARAVRSIDPHSCRP